MIAHWSQSCLHVDRFASLEATAYDGGLEVGRRVWWLVSSGVVLRVVVDQLS